MTIISALKGISSHNDFSNSIGTPKVGNILKIGLINGNRRISKDISALFNECCSCGGKLVGRVMYGLFAGIIHPIEEIYFSVTRYNNAIEFKNNIMDKHEIYLDDDWMFGLGTVPRDFDNLSQEDQSHVVKFYKTAYRAVFMRYKSMSQEASIQLVYQFVRLLAKNKYWTDDSTTTSEEYKNVILHQIPWMVYEVFSLTLSAVSTISPVLDRFKINFYKRHNREPNFADCALEVILITLRLVMWAISILSLMLR